MTVELIQGLLVAFAIVVILMNPYIRLLRFVGMGKQIRAEGPDSHQVKQGTPTMGGLLILTAVIVPTGIPPIDMMSTSMNVPKIAGKMPPAVIPRVGSPVRNSQEM